MQSRELPCGRVLLAAAILLSVAAPSASAQVRAGRLVRCRVGAASIWRDGETWEQLERRLRTTLPRSIR